MTSAIMKQFLGKLLLQWLFGDFGTTTGMLQKAQHWYLQRLALKINRNAITTCNFFLREIQLTEAVGNWLCLQRLISGSHMMDTGKNQVAIIIIRWATFWFLPWHWKITGMIFTLSFHSFLKLLMQCSNTLSQNLTVSAFGDTGRAAQSAESLEMGLLGAIKYNQKELPEMLASMKKLIDGGKYKRESSGFLGLLCFLPEIPDPTIQYEWPRTGTLEFARYFLQRNGTDPNTGLMVGVQGATYNHNHCNGMAMELYGLGEVLGIDAGTGANYEHPLHRNYYSQWAAHNTVVAAGSSSSLPFSGAAGTKQIGQIELVAMEPLPDSVAVSPDYSFTDTRYFDKSTKTNQRRLLSIVRTSPTTGYYVDIYRSDNPVSNDYVYHNIGDKIEFIGTEGQVLKTERTSYPVTELDYPGFRFYSDVNKIENYNQNLVALFTIQEENFPNNYMRVLIPGDKNRTYFTAFSPKVKTAGKRYNDKQQPLFTIRTNGEAWNSPFIAVFEPFSGKDNKHVKSVEKLTSLSSDKNTTLKVDNMDGSEQLILQGNDCSSEIENENLKFKGYFGIISFTNNKLDRIYMGQGGKIGYGQVLLEAVNGVFSGELKLLGEKEATLKCNAKVYFTLKNSATNEITFLRDGKEEKLKGKNVGNTVTFMIPPVSDARLSW